MNRWSARWLAFCLLAAIARAQEPEFSPLLARMPEYQPAGVVTGTIRLWGHGSTKVDFMGRLVRRWEAGFAKYQPGVHFDYRMYGTASAIGALYTGAGDLALMGEEIFPYEEAAYEKAMGRPPARIEIATGSLDVSHFDFAQVFFVHRTNPLGRMTLAQLDAIFGTDHLRGEPKNFRKWGDLGLTGEWADRPIHVYGWDRDNDFWIYLGQRLLGGSNKINCDLKGFSHIPRRDGTIYEAGQQILEALAKDPDGIAVSTIQYLNPQVKALALAENDSGPFVYPTKTTVISREYPLMRVVPAVFNRKSGEPMDPATREFLRYILSRQGQGDIAEDGEYLPLNPEAVRAELAKLGPEPIRVWGSDRMVPVVRALEQGYARSHPGVSFVNRLRGTGTAMAGLYSGDADLALMGRQDSAVEVMAFAWIYRYPPTGIPVMMGSTGAPGQSPTVAVLVRRDNPVASLNDDELERIFCCQPKSGPPIGGWHLYLRNVDSGTSAFFRDTVLRGNRNWAFARMQEFNDRRLPDGSTEEADGRIAAAAAQDPNGIALANPRFAGPELKTVARFPRTIWAYVNRPPNSRIDPQVRDFLSYVLSPPAQSLIPQVSPYQPLPSDALAASRSKL
jgi:phosphate transport system substrate-binding protein